MYIHVHVDLGMYRLAYSMTCRSHVLADIALLSIHVCTGNSILSRDHWI